MFDDFHPNKADVNITLAGSNGGSWSTSFLPNSSLKPYDGEGSVTQEGNVAQSLDCFFNVSHLTNYPSKSTLTSST
ncbi:putative TIFY/JAZ family protein [Helianthus debilis subsp. tardiflorus]